MFRNKTGIGWTITLVGLSMSTFHLVVAWYGPPDALTLRCVHLGFALTLAFLMLPLSRRYGKADTPRWLEFILIAISIVVCGYLVVEQADSRIGKRHDLEELRIQCRDAHL